MSPGVNGVLRTWGGSIVPYSTAGGALVVGLFWHVLVGMIGPLQPAFKALGCMPNRALPKRGHSLPCPFGPDSCACKGLVWFLRPACMAGPLQPAFKALGCMPNSALLRCVLLVLLAWVPPPPAAY